jgi:hypothetical protein
MERKTFPVENVTSVNSVRNVRMRAMQSKAGRMYPTDADIVKQRCFFNKLAGFFRQRQTISNLQRKVCNMPAMFKNNFKRCTLKISS